MFIIVCGPGLAGGRFAGGWVRGGPADGGPASGGPMVAGVPDDGGPTSEGPAGGACPGLEEPAGNGGWEPKYRTCDEAVSGGRGGPGGSVPRTPCDGRLPCGTADELLAGGGRTGPGGLWGRGWGLHDGTGGRNDVGKFCPATGTGWPTGGLVFKGTAGAAICKYIATIDKSKHGALILQFAYKLRLVLMANFSETTWIAQQVKI